MKPVLFIPPAIAIIIGGYLVGAQRVTIDQLERESEILRKHISASLETSIAPGRSAVPGRALANDDPDAIDWEKMAEVFREMDGLSGMRNTRKMTAFQSRLQKIDEEELLAAWEKIAALDLHDGERMMPQSMILGLLIAKDPELALTRLSKHISQESNMGVRLASALGAWVEKDAAAASEWFDRQIAAGTFDSKSLDGKNQIRTIFEYNLVAQLLSQDPAVAKARVAALPADQRKELLEQFSVRPLNEKTQAAFADLVRSQERTSDSEKRKEALENID